MSDANVEIARKSWDAYSRGDFQASLSAYDENTIWDDTQYRPDGAVHVGVGPLVEVVRSWRGAWDSYEVEVEDVVDAGGDRVVVALREQGRGKGGGIELTNRWAVVVTLRDEKIVHSVVFRTPEEALDATGLSD